MHLFYFFFSNKNVKAWRAYVFKNQILLQLQL